MMAYRPGATVVVRLGLRLGRGRFAASKASFEGGKERRTMPRSYGVGSVELEEKRTYFGERPGGMSLAE